MIWLNLIYVVGVILAVCLAYSPLRFTWFAQFVTLFTPFFFLPLLPLALLSLFVRDWVGLGCLIIPSLWFLFEYGESLLPKAQTRSPESTLRVMTWNALYLNSDVQSALAAIQRHQPDILALQELGVDLADGLAQALDEEYPHKALFPRNSPKGYGIFSCFPITDSIPPNIAEGHYWSQQVTICIPATNEQNAREITLISAHPRIPDIHLHYWLGIPVPVGFDTQPQDSQLRCLLQQVDRTKGPLLLAGDFNMSDRQPMYREFAGRLCDAQRKVGNGFGFTFPTDLSILDYFKVPIPALPMIPFLRLDYLFYNHYWRAVRTQNGSIAGSDHRYLVADLALDL